MRGARIVGALAALSLLVAGCSGGGDDDDGAAGPAPTQAHILGDIQLASALRPIGSCDELRSWARDELAPRIGATGFPGVSYFGGGPVFAEGDGVLAAPRRRRVL